MRTAIFFQLPKEMLAGGTILLIVWCIVILVLHPKVCMVVMNCDKSTFRDHPVRRITMHSGIH